MLYLFLEALAGLIGFASFVLVFVHLYRYAKLSKFVTRRSVYVPMGLFLVAVIAGLLANRTYPPNFAMPAFMHAHTPDGLPAAIPLSGMIDFFRSYARFERVADIGADPNAVPPGPLEPGADGIVRINLRTQEVIAEVAPGVSFNYWTFNGQVPGPMLRIREGAMVELTVTNDPSSLHGHSIDLHAVTGPGGGAALTNLAPGETKAFLWKALHPGLYMYHCASPNVSTHHSHGQYGLILVEPQDGLPKVDKEFYLVQGELYTVGQLGKRGLVPFDAQAFLDGIPNYVTFNGKVESAPRMKARVGDKVRIYVGNGGVNLVSSFHVIGEIFDVVYPNASMGGALERNTQVAQVLPGGASIIEFTLDVPGRYLIVDHALARMNKGAWAVLEVEGPERPDVFSPVTSRGMNLGREDDMLGR